MGCGPRCADCALTTIGAGFTEVEIGQRYSAGRLLLVGEASGEAEARESLPFRPYAQSGSLLADALRTVGVGRGDVAITNVIRCRPPKDWLTGAPYESNAIYNCTLRYLSQVIEELKPRCILALGGTAYRALAAAPKGKYGTLDYARGYVVGGAGVATGVPVIATYHPAFIRRGMAHLTPLLHRDLRRAWLVAQGKLIEGRHYALDPRAMGLAYQTAPSLDEAWDYCAAIDPDAPLAYDTETTRSVREDEDERVGGVDVDIKLFQCTQKRGAGIAIPYRDEFVDVVRSILQKARVKVGYNCWNYDDPILEAHGIAVGMTNDAMVMFGTFWSDLPKNLQAAAQMCGFPFPWKAFGESDLEFYGCADVDATLCVYESMKGTLEREQVGL